jgi:hypothetical protein
MLRMTLVQRLKSFLIVALCCAMVVPSALGLELGRMATGRIAMKPLNRPMVMTRAYLARVGGVAFSGVVELPESVTIKGIRYVPDQDDGERLRLMIGKRDQQDAEVIVPLHDWQLIPLVKFADSDSHSCVTLFGEPENPADDAVLETQRAGGFLAGYHPAFNDTLLGLRLLQADMLILDPLDDSLACDLFKEQGEYVLGAGEHAPDLEQNRERHQAVREWLEQQDPGFDSYLICDHGVKLRADVENGRLTIDGAPYWYCWRHTDEFREKEAALVDDGEVEAGEMIGTMERALSVDARAMLLERRYVQRLREAIDRLNVLQELILRNVESEREWLLEFQESQSRIQAITERLTDEFIERLVELDEESEATAESRIMTVETREELASRRLATAAIGRIMKRVAVLDSKDPLRSEIAAHDEQVERFMAELKSRNRLALDALPDDAAIEHLRPLSDGLSHEMETHQGINPTVYDALLVTMRYSALFRRIKQAAPESWKALVAELESASGGPESPVDYQVETPNLISFE